MEAARRTMDRLRLTGLIALALAAVSAGSVAHAQYRLEFGYCERLQAQYQAAVQRAGGAGITTQKMVQIDGLSRQLAEAQTAAQRLGCNGGFLFFQPRRSPQCPTVMANVNRLSRQLSQLRGGNGFFFLGSSPEADVARLRDALDGNGCGIPGLGGTRTLCVRLCDGYYFPVETSASSDRFDVDATFCQSMYTADGLAQLFVQSGDDDVADATSLSGERYGDQSYAFAYRQSYAPSCVAQLHAGMTALARRYFAQLPALRHRVATGLHSPVPLPQLRRPASEDPETLANAAGNFIVKPVNPAVATADTPAKAVRMVGPAYYADMFDLSKARKQASLRPSLSIITPAAASEAPRVEPAVDEPADEPAIVPADGAAPN
jgi:hypothetical protein